MLTGSAQAKHWVLLQYSALNVLCGILKKQSASKEGLRLRLQIQSECDYNLCLGLRVQLQSET